MTFTRKIRNAVAKTSDGLPTLGAWLERVRAIGDDRLIAAVEGIWCGREGRVTVDLTDSKSMLCVGWHAGRVEWAYIS